MAETPTACMADNYVEDLWPIAKYPALNPKDYQTAEAFSSLQKPFSQIFAEAKEDAVVSLNWKYVRARDGEIIPVLVYESKRRRTSTALQRPLLFVTHGGGWISGDFTVEDPWCRRAVEQLDCVVASVHYRLSPAHQFPVPLNDCVDALDQILAESSEIQFDKDKIILGGSSAGASLACGIFQRKLLELKSSVKGHLLNIPVTCDVKHFPSEHPNESWVEHSSSPILSAESMSFCFDQYFPSRAKEPLVSPLLSPVVDQFPPCVILCAERDPLRDQGLALRDLLQAKGIPWKCKVYRGVPHGFHGFENAPAAHEAIEDMVTGIAWMLGQSR